MCTEMWLRHIFAFTNLRRAISPHLRNTQEKYILWRFRRIAEYLLLRLMT